MTKPVRIVQLAVDWKESFNNRAISRAIKLVGDDGVMTEHTQGDVDCNIAYISSVALTSEQLDQLWTVGDLWLDDECVEGDTFEEVLEQLRASTAKRDRES